jgi:hypothetical protein
VLAYGEACGSASLREFPYDFFFWGYIKDLVYSITICTVEVLRGRVENAATTIRDKRKMLERGEESFHRCLHHCIDNNDGHFEHFL